MPEKCRNCGKPKGEHHKKELWCFDSIEWFYENKPDTKFEPAPQKIKRWANEKEKTLY